MGSQPVVVQEHADALGIVFGQVWLPHTDIVLGRQAGLWFQHVLECRDAWIREGERLSWRLSSLTCPMLELAGFLLHKLGRGVPSWQEREEFVQFMREALSKPHAQRTLTKIPSLVQRALF